MDILKACTTNVQVLTDIDTTPVRVFAYNASLSSSISPVSSAIARLREKGFVCTGNDSRIWLFQPDEEEASAEDILSEFVLESSGTIAEPGQVGGMEDLSVVTTFIGALEASFSFALLRTHGASRLSTWKWLLPETGQHASSILIQMQHRLSEDGKKLNVATNIQESDLTELTNEHVRGSCEVILAPAGLSAKFAHGGQIGSRTTKAPAELRNDQWKTLVRKALLAEGIHLAADVAWVYVIPLGSTQGALWPASLCFVPLENIGADQHEECFPGLWKSWFQNTDLEPQGDPLLFAEEWSAGFTDREQARATHDASAVEDTAMEDAPSAQPLANPTAFDVTSPPLTNRPDLQAFHGIYPTPPDGLATHSGLQVHVQTDNLPAPTLDTVNQPAFTPSDPPQENTAGLDGASVDEAEQPLRNHSIVSSVGVQGNEWNRGSSDDLFGDMDDLEYGREEVGDADFNFFDEPDEVPEKMDMTALPPPGADTNTAHQDTGTADKEQAHDADLMERLDRSKVNFNAHHELRLEEPTSTVRSNELPPTSPKPQTEHVVVAESDHALPNVHHPTESLPGKALKSGNIKPLSPFGVRETLLPPPIPASASQVHQNSEKERRRSSFGPLVFNPSGSLTYRSSSYDYADYKPGELATSHDLAPTRVPLVENRKSPSSTSSTSSLYHPDLDDGDESDSDACSLSTRSDHTPTADVKSEDKILLATKKRKRTFDTFAYCGPQIGPTQSSGRIEKSHQQVGTNAGSDQRSLLLLLLGKNNGGSQQPEESSPTGSIRIQPSPSHQIVRSCPTHNADSTASETEGPFEPAAASDPSSKTLIEIFPELKPEDLVIISQVVAEQAASVTKNIAQGLDALVCSALDTISDKHRVLNELGETIKESISRLTVCDIPSLTLVRESLPVQRPQPSHTTSNLASQARHPPRPPPRIDPTTLGPDILPLPASYIRVQRGDAAWEMVPAALSFWEALGLGPISGTKDIRHVCVAPDGDLLGCQLTGFLENLKATYESCKFGSMALGTETTAHLATHSIGIPAITSIGFDSSAGTPIVPMAQAYWHACAALGVQLASMAFDEPGRTFVVSMINPFDNKSSKYQVLVDQCFAACFSQLSKAYRTAAARIAKSDGKIVSQTTMSDIDFNVLPISLVASTSSLVVFTAQQMGFVAREFYDRCPPSSDAMDDPCPMSNAAAPSVELVAPLPKRISFQLTSDPPTDLLHEASVLHVAYAISTDGDWANVVWHDNTGRYTSSSSFCLQGRSFADIALEVWQRTMQLIKAREVIWRVFIATTGSFGVEASRANCWKDIIAQHTDRKQLLSVTLLHFQPELSLRILPPMDSATQTGQGTGSGAPTPVTTPLPVNGQVGSTASPDTVGAGNTAGTAPPTPAPSEAATTILEADPEAHLIETEDETWGMLIDRHVASILRPVQAKAAALTHKQNHVESLSHGVLIKRGKNVASSETITHSGQTPFPCAGASLIWTLRVRPKSDRQGSGAGGGAGGERPNVDEGSARHAEVMLREVLGFFRNLALLSKIKGLDPTGLIPVHIATAAQGAEGLNGLLARPTEVRAETVVI